MKTIGTCKDCKWWDSEDWRCDHEKVGDKQHIRTDTASVDTQNAGDAIFPGPDFGCVHWERETTNPNYPVKSSVELLNEDLQRENDCAAEKIRRLSEALYELGVDPTQI